MIREELATSDKVKNIEWLPACLMIRCHTESRMREVGRHKMLMAKMDEAMKNQVFKNAVDDFNTILIRWMGNEMIGELRQAKNSIDEVRKKTLLQMSLQTI